MASQTPGIQQLLAAERKAAETVTEAKNRRIEKLKKAAEEAAEEAEIFRLEKDKAFKEFEQASLKSGDQAAQQIDKETDKEIDEMKKKVQKKLKDVAKDLVDYITDFVPAVHYNYRKIVEN